MGNRLLLADDSITIQKVVGIIFANEDCELTVVDNGDAALEKAREARPDVMLVDALMPGKTGYEVCTAIRKDPTLGNTPLLLMTGAFEPFDEEKARQCGADDFISKPFESQQLVDKVKSLMALGKGRGASAPAPVAPAFAEPEEFISLEIDEPTVDVEPLVAAAPLAGLGVAAVAGASFMGTESFDAGVDVASADDDLWGAFELEDEVAGDEVVEFGEVVTGEETVGEIVDASPFALKPADESLRAGVAAAAEPSGFDLPAEDDFVFMEEEPIVSAGPGRVEAFVADSSEDAFVFGEPEPYDAFGSFGAVSETFAPVVETFEATREEPLAAMPDIQFAPEEEYVPAPEILAAAAVTPVVAAAEASAIPAGAGAAVSLTEEQLAAAISRISREIIERIAWEVVPELAETLIKEEIRRIKEGK
ncbi:MAG: response regulator [Desulfuromonadales bacterium]|nr:MAG: response regulator [Desulfuromonadales bacterium]